MSQGLANISLSAGVRGDHRHASDNPATGVDQLAALKRGDFAALVFCGHRTELIDIAGESTAKTIYKFILNDERLSHADDFARSEGYGLPEWPAGRVAPYDGVCFVFATGDESPLRTLRGPGGGAIEGEHYIVVADARRVARRDAHHRFAAFAEALVPSSTIAVIGYGHQGSTLVNLLRNDFDVSAERLIIIEDNLESQRSARKQGLTVAPTSNELPLVDAAIYSPLSRYEKLWQIFEHAQQRGAAGYDNSHQNSGADQFVRRGRFHLDGAANRALYVDGDRLSLGPHGLALPCHVVREECRTFGGVSLPHLHADHAMVLTSMEESIDISHPARCDALNAATWNRTEGAYVSLRSGPELGYFAARCLCERLWCSATRAIFPSRHIVDLGATEFERLLLAHHDVREIVTTMQTPAQRVTLGVAARRYSCDRPIVEIGSALGGSALLMAAATVEHKPPMYSIDPDAPTRGIMRFAFERAGFADRLTQIVEPSDRAINRLAHLHGSAGLVFIDGLHTQSGVLSDFELFAPLLARGGALVFHDVVPALHGVFSVVMNRVMHDARFQAKCLVDGLMVFERSA